MLDVEFISVVAFLAGGWHRHRRWKKLVFDLSGVNYIDSTGLGILTFCSATMQAGGGALRVAGAHALPQKLFQLTKLDKILSFFPTVEDAWYADEDSETRQTD